MAVLTDRSTGDTALRPFTIEVPEADLEELRARIAATRRPEKETVGDQSHGVQLATVQELARYWGTDYQAPRSWAKRAYPNLLYLNEVDRGGRFAAWEEPELFSAEIRAAFRSLRTTNGGRHD
jgi:Epoxide hydrolase N terminus